MISTPENQPNGTRPVTLKEIEDGCAELASVRSRAEKFMAKVEKQRQAILDEHKDELNELAHKLEIARTELELRVAYGREFFKKPKTLTFSGIVVGYQKSQDKVVTPSEPVLIANIEKMLKAKAGTLIRNVKSIVAEAFKQLSVQEKQMLGCSTLTGADKVVVRAEAKSDVEKYFAACVTAVEVEEVK